MKGQTVNVDWVVGLFIFVTVLASGIFVLTDDRINIVERDSALKEKAELVQESLEDETFVEARKVPLYARGPTGVGRIPIDRNYVFPSEAYRKSALFRSIPSEIDEKADNVIAAVDTGNRTYRMTYFFSNTTNASYTNSIDTGEWINTTNLSVKPGGNGIESLRLNGKEILNSSADLNSNDDSITEKELHAHTLGGDLKIYNSTDEMILENPGTVNFDLKNFTTLYWHNGSTTTNLFGKGTFNDSVTSGFTVSGYQGSEYGVTFIGDMNATVSKDSNQTVKAEITEDDRLRIFLHDSDYTKGKKRARFFTNGEIFFGTEKKLEGAQQDEIDRLDGLTKSEFESRFELENWQYNITFGNMEKGEPIPFEKVVVDQKRSVVIGREGNYSGIDNRVTMWR